MPHLPTGDRAGILARIADALSVPTDPHVRPPVPGHPGESPDYSAVLPPVGASHAERVAAFAARSAALRTEFVTVPDLAAAGAHVAALAREQGWRRVALHRATVLAGAECGLRDSGLELLHTDAGYGRTALEQCDAGLTACDALVAQTGSVMLTAASAGGRALSVLPPHHVVIATADQLVPHLPAAYARLAGRYRGAWPSFVTLITGPSRTGDIERILVLGAHGPRRLTVILAPDA